MAQRTDTSSISFGRRLARAELDAATAKQELAELRNSLPNNQALQAAALTGDVIKQQRKLAKQTIARGDATIDDLNSIDPSVLTPAFQEQLRDKKRNVLLAAETQTPQMLNIQDPAVLQRFENWKASARTTPQQQKEFASSNLWPDQLTPFQKWDRRMHSPAGRLWNQQRLAAEYQQGLSKAQAKLKTAKPKEGGRYYGGVRKLEDL